MIIRRKLFSEDYENNYWEIEDPIQKEFALDPAKAAKRLADLKNSAFKDKLRAEFAASRTPAQKAAMARARATRPASEMTPMGWVPKKVGKSLGPY